MGLFKYGTLEFLTFLKVCSFDWISLERRTNMFLDTDFFRTAENSRGWDLDHFKARAARRVQPVAWIWRFGFWIQKMDGIDGPFRLFQILSDSFRILGIFRLYQSVCFFVWRPVDSTLDTENRHWRRGKLSRKWMLGWNFHMNQLNNIEFRCI